MTRVLGFWLACLWFTNGLAAPTLPAGILKLQPYAAPALQLADMDGNHFDLRQARGHWVFVHFWASWCAPCRREMPTIQRMHAQFAHSRLQVVLINTAEDDDTVFTFLSAVAPQLTSLMDRDGQTTASWRPRGLPATYLVDPQGTVRFQALGGRRWDQHDYRQFLQHLMDGAGKPDTR